MPNLLKHFGRYIDKIYNYHDKTLSIQCAKFIVHHSFLTVMMNGLRYATYSTAQYSTSQRPLSRRLSFLLHKSLTVKLKSLRYLGPKIWNIPPYIRNSKNIEGFMRKIKCSTSKYWPCRLCLIYICHFGYVNWPYFLEAAKKYLIWKEILRWLFLH